MVKIEKLADLLAKHQPIFGDVDGVPDGMVRCNWTDCGFMITAGDWYDWQEMFARHQAIVVAAFLEPQP